MPDRPTVYLLTYNDTAVANPIARAFEERGWTCRQFIYAMPKVSPTIIRLRKLADPMVARKLLAGEYNRVIREELAPALQSDPPDLLLVMKGHRIDADNFAAIETSGVPVFLWFYDSQERFQHQGDLVPLAKKIYVIDRSDIADDRYSWLPLGFDEQVYRPSDDSPLFDIFFIGKLEPRYYKTRREYLLMLARSELPKRYRVGFIGTTGNRIRDRLLGIKPPFQWLAPRMPADKYAAMIARAKVVVNVHQDDGGEPVNPMFFATAGCRVCQVMEQRDYLTEWMTPNEAYVPVTRDTFLSTLEMLLADHTGRKRVAEAGYQQALKHTFAARVDRLLQDFAAI